MVSRDIDCALDYDCFAALKDKPKSNDDAEVLKKFKLVDHDDSFDEEDEAPLKDGQIKAAKPSEDKKEVFLLEGVMRCCSSS
jgi:hypothetical protein